MSNQLKYFITFAFILIAVVIIFKIIQTKYDDFSPKTLGKKDFIIPPYQTDKEIKSVNTKSNIDIFNYEQFENIQNLIFNWNIIFDIFTSNDKNQQFRYTISNNTLHQLSKKLRNVQDEFYKGSSDEILNQFGSTIKEECNYYKLDYRLVLAIMKQESAFTSNALSHAGAYGFMQIMPRTGSGLEQTLQLEDYKSPKNNLVAGIYYYALLVARYDAAGEEKYKFALAAYNAGSGHVEDAMSIAYYFNEDYLKWDNVREKMKMLGSENDSLHQKVWNSKPPAGVFSNWKEPVNYVSNVMFYWASYKKIYKNK